MRRTVGAEGVLVPRELLGEAREVDIRQEEHQIVVVPLDLDDPIWGLGRDPVDVDEVDASERHDDYIYEQR